MNHKLKSLLLLLVVAISAKAQIENGKVYNFVNVENNGQSMAIASNNDVTITETNTADYTQLWYVLQNSDFSYSLRNLGSGRYLRSSNATSEKWTMVKELDNNCKFRCVTAGEGYTLRATNTYADYHFMHYGANEGRVVCWSTDAKATQWTMNEVGISSAELNNNWNVLSGIDPSDEVIASYQTHLDNLFNDKACTVLKKSFDSESALKGNADYLALPVTLQDMVLKVYQNNWTEDNYDNSKTSWGSDYAKKYRVQLYEPYNEPEAAASALGLNAHTNLNNPTGIFANKYQSLYIMVEGPIKDGASLYLASYTGNGKPDSYNDGVELTEGLNIIPSFVDGNNYCINYVVHTFDTSKGKGSKAKAYRLSEFDDLKIHIEGGYINGYWNKMGDNLYTPDTNSDWDYIEERATQTTVTVLGEYITLQFPLHAKDAVDNDGRPNEGLSYYLNQVGVEDVIDEWDNVMLWERLLLGVLDGETVDKEAKKSPYADKERVIDYTGDDAEFATGYGDYYNVHGLSFGVGVNYMYGGWDHCGYHYNTMQSIIVDILTNAGSHWGPGHEIGHQHQNLLNLNGLTEVTNNLFSNVVLWYFGETTSRYNGVDGALSNVLAAYNTEGSDFYTNNIWAQTHMYYKLFLYYHVLGHNPKFYPRLFEMLRQDPMINGAHIDGATSLLHFYKKCCYASGDDLTEFFRAHGFFRVMTDRLVGDYSNGTYNMSQKDINEAIAEIKDWAKENEAKENISVLFINDATGGAIKSHKGDYLELYGETTVCAEVGSYASFNSNTTPNYSYSMAGNVMTMSGSGGVGFAVLDEKGEILAFSDKKTFTISKECEAAVISGKAEVVAVKADNTRVNVFDIMSSGNAETKHVALGELITSVRPVLGLIDADGTKPGFYSPSVVETLQSVYDEAYNVYNNREEEAYVRVYDALRREYFNMEGLGIGQTPIIPNSTYVLTSKGTSGVSMVLMTSNYAVVGADVNVNDVMQQWIFEGGTGEENTYYIKSANPNVGVGGYLGSLKESRQIEATSTKDEAKGYKAIYLGNGVWALQCQDEDLQSLNYNGSSNKVLGWDYNGDANSHWYLTATNIDAASVVLHDLYSVIKKTRSLVDEMADVRYVDGVSIIDDIDEKYVNFISVVQMKAICDQVLVALQKYNMGQATFEDVEALQEQYEILITAYNSANDTGFNALKDQLFALISSANSLLDSCGKVTYAPETSTEKLVLQTTNPTGENYLYTNAPEPEEGDINNLLDDDETSYFHSAWSWDVNATHYLQVDLGEGNSLEEFAFSYMTAKRPYPYEIRVYGSNDDVDYAPLGIFSKDDTENRLPTTSEGIDDYRVLWISPNISSESAYRYLRFELTNSGGKWSNPNPKGEYCLVMSYFGITAFRYSEDYIVELGDDVGDVTEELLLATYHVTKDAQTVYDRATSENQLQKAIDDLREQYSELFFAKDGTVKAALREWIDNTDRLIASCGTVTSDDNGDFIVTLLPATAGDVTAELLIAAYVANEQARVLLENGTKDEVEMATATLKSKCEALELEQQSTVKSTLRALISETAAVIERCGVVSVVDGVYTAILGTTPGDVTVDFLIEVYKANELASEVLNDVYSTKEELAETTVSLQTQCDLLEASQQSTAKAELRELIAKTSELIAECGTITYGESEFITPISLQTVDSESLFYLLTNAQEKNEGDIKNLLQTGSSTFFHSSWSARVGETHYLQVDLGDENTLNEFVFAYTTRDNGDAGPHPSVIVVSGSNSVDDSFVELATFSSGLPTTGNTRWEAASAIVSSQAFRYLRFAVTQSLGLNKCKHDNPDEYYFAMSEFALYNVSHETNYYVDSLNPYGSVTETQLLEVFYAKNEAEKLAEKSADKVAIEAKKVELQTLYDALLVANETSLLPIILTVDIENPVLYTVNSKRDPNKVLQYDPEDGHMFSMAEVSEDDATQAFYFTLGDTRTQVYIHPFAAGEQVLAADNVDNGTGKVFVKEKGGANYEQWTFEEETIDGVRYYSLKAVGSYAYFSNYGGGSKKMGFHHLKDEESRLTFNETVMEGSGAFHSLKIYHDEVAMVGLVGGDAPGYYPEKQVSTYNEIYAMAAKCLEGENTYAQCLGAYQELRTANESLEINMPEAGKCYVFRSVTKNALAYAVPADNTICWSADKNSDDAVAVWTITPSATEGFFNICNLGTGTYMNRFANQVPSPLSETAGDIEIVSLSGDGQVGIKCDGTMMHVQYDGAVVHWNTGANEGSAWRIEEVSNATGIENEVMENDAIIYDLYGRRIIDVVASGLYIVNGKKCYITK